MPKMLATTTDNASSARDNLLIGFVFLLPVLASWFFLPQLSDAFRIKNHLVSVGGCLLLVLGLMSPRVALYRLPAVIRIALACCVVAMTISTLLSSQPIIAWHAVLEYLPIGLLLLLMVSYQNADRMALVLESSWLVAALGVALVAIQQTVFPGWLDFGFAATGKMTAFSTLGNPIWASLLLVAALPLAVRRAMTGTLALWVLPVILAIAIIMTQSRQAWLAVVVVCWVAVVWRGSRQYKRLALIVLALILCSLPFVDFSAGAFHSLQGRVLIMGGAWRALAEHPLTGVGLGHFSAVYPSYQAELLGLPRWSHFAEHAAVVEDAHNEFLHWGASTGALGLAGFGLLCGAIAWLGWRSPKIMEKRWHWYLGYVGILIMLLFTGIQPYSTLTLILVCFQAVLLAEIVSRESRHALPKALHLLCIAAALALGSLTIDWAIRDVHASYLEGQGDQLLQERDSWLAKQTFAEALMVDNRRAGLLKKHASILYLEGRNTEALNELAMAKTYSGDTGITLLEAEILVKMRRDTEAIAAYQAIIASFPLLLSPHFILGQLYYRQGQHALARAEFERVVHIPPSQHNHQQTLEKIKQQKAMAQAFLDAMDHRQSAIKAESVR